jgi:hypothetical protein
MGPSCFWFVRTLTGFPLSDWVSLPELSILFCIASRFVWPYAYVARFIIVRMEFPRMGRLSGSMSRGNGIRGAWHDMLSEKFLVKKSKNTLSRARLWIQEGMEDGSLYIKHCIKVHYFHLGSTSISRLCGPPDPVTCGGTRDSCSRRTCDIYIAVVLFFVQVRPISPKKWVGYVQHSCARKIFITQRKNPYWPSHVIFYEAVSWGKGILKEIQDCNPLIFTHFGQ